MKKFITLLLVVALVFAATACLTSCVNNPDNGNNPGDNPGNNPGDNPGGDPGEQPDDGDEVPWDPDNHRVFYQIFVGSFSDSNGDGIGDIRGIINRMDYLNDGKGENGQSLGVEGLWLSPIFESPSYHKYDAKDYYKIDSKFGTEADLRELLSICHKRNVKVILDLAINHSSSQNQWFVDFCAARKSNNTESPYYDFYTCYERGDPDAPSKSSYHFIPGSSTLRYEGNFSGDMPEMNYDNPAVREEMLNVAKYWLDVGVDGFRFDAVKYIYYYNDAKSVQFWNWYMEELKKIRSDIYVVGECWDADSIVMKYYEAMNCFDFSMSGPEGKVASAIRGNKIATYTNYVVNFISEAKTKNPDAMFQPFLANHDMDRSAGFLTLFDGKAFMAANMYILCSGSPTIYYGEEIGMKGTRGGANTDANRRLAMLWGDNDTVADPIGADFSKSKQSNGTVAKQQAEANSLLNYYKKVIAMRNKYPAIARGEYTALQTKSQYVGGFVITYNGETYVLLHNTSGTETVTVALPEGCSAMLDFIGLNSAVLENGQLTIDPNTSVILK